MRVHEKSNENNANFIHKFSLSTIWNLKEATVRSHNLEDIKNVWDFMSREKYGKNIYIKYTCTIHTHVCFMQYLYYINVWFVGIKIAENEILLEIDEII